MTCNPSCITHGEGKCGSETVKCELKTENTCVRSFYIENACLVKQGSHYFMYSLFLHLKTCVIKTQKNLNWKPIFCCYSDPSDPDVKVLGGQRLSLLDIAKVNLAYDCTLDPPICREDGYKYLGTGATSGFIDGRNLEGPCR